MTYIFENGDAAGNTTTGASMQVGDFFSGTITAGDSDYIAVNLVAGQTYTIAMVGIGALSDGLADPYLFLHNSAGTQVASDDDSGPGRTSDIQFTATYTGTYYIAARDYYTTNTGEYMISVTSGTRADYEYQMGAGALLRDDASWSASSGTPTTVTFAFRGTGNAQDASGNATGFEQLTAAQQAAALQGFAMFSDVSGLSFAQVNPGGTSENATILLGAYTSTTDGAGAYAYFPGSTAASSNAGDIWLNNDLSFWIQPPVWFLQFLRDAA